MITNASVTIYNKVYDRDEGSNKYYRTVLKGVNWQDATKVLPSDTGVVSADVAEVYIPFLIDTEKNIVLRLILIQSRKRINSSHLLQRILLLKELSQTNLQSRKMWNTLKISMAA